MEEKKENNRIRVAITQGDINGISYEVILKTFSDSRMYDICTPSFTAPPRWLRTTRNSWPCIRT